MSGYLQRVCHKIINPTLLWRFLKHNPNRYPQSSESAMLDRFPHNSLDLRKIEAVTGLRRNDIEGMAFIKIIRKFAGNDVNYSAKRMLSDELEDGRRFCPICLREDGYYQLLWQVKEIKICLKHGIHLFDRCPRCGNPVFCLFPGAVVGYCQCVFNLKSVKTLAYASEREINQQERVWRDWQELTESWSLTQIPGLDEKKSLATTIMYIASDFNSNFEGLKDINTTVSEITLRSILQLARGSKATKTLVHVRAILTLLREKGLSVAEVGKIKVSESFVSSINEAPGKYLGRYNCIAPWCKSFGKNGGLKKAGTSSKARMDGTKLKYYFYCQDCGIEYALNDKDEIVERGYFIDIGWGQVRELVLTNKSRRQISEELRITVDQVIRCTAYMAANRLLPKEARNKFLGKPEDKKVFNNILRAIKSGVHIKTIQRDLKLAYHELLYYRYKVEAIKAINSVIERRSPKIDLGENNIKTLVVLKELINNEEKITIELVAQKLGVCHETLRNWGVLPVIAEYKEQQQEEKDHRFNSELKTKAEAVIQELVEAGEEVKSETVYKALGVRRNVLVRKFPDVTKYIASLLKEQRDRVHQAKVKEYVSVAKTLIKAARFRGETITIEDIAETLELSVAGVSRYPQISGLLRDIRLRGRGYPSTTREKQ